MADIICEQPLTQATLQETRKRKKDQVAKNQKRGRQRQQDPKSRVLERQGPGPSRSQEPSPARGQGCWSQMATRNRHARMRNQDWILIVMSGKLSQGKKSVRS